MGFTALDGLMMGTRCGTIDPGVILYMLQQQNLAPAEIETLLYQRSGLLGVSGLSSDMRVLLASSAVGAGEAIELFVFRIAREPARSAGWTASSSPPVSASMRPKSAGRSANGSPGSAS
jgi:acetate kinase